MVKTPPDSIPGQAIKIPQDTGIAKKKKSYIFRTTHTHTYTHTQEGVEVGRTGREGKESTNICLD